VNVRKTNNLKPTSLSKISAAEELKVFTLIPVAEHT
jgi:hypothetical protein